MNENIESSLPESSAQSWPQDLPDPLKPGGLLEPVLVELPPALAKLVQQCSQRSGQTQAAVIVSVLKLAFGLASDADPGISTQLQPLAARLHTVEDRLDQLEGLRARLENLEGKSLAF